MIRFSHRGSFSKAEKFLRRAKAIDYRPIAEKYGRSGVEALSLNTPKDSGDTANAWSYEIVPRKNGFSLTWRNSNVSDGIPIVILIQYGHGTRSGSFVEGIDFINPAMKPIFDDLAENLWKEVTSP